MEAMVKNIYFRISKPRNRLAWWWYFLIFHAGGPRLRGRMWTNEMFFTCSLSVVLGNRTTTSRIPCARVYTEPNTRKSLGILASSSVVSSTGRKLMWVVGWPQGVPSCQNIISCTQLTWPRSNVLTHTLNTLIYRRLHWVLHAPYRQMSSGPDWLVFQCFQLHHVGWGVFSTWSLSVCKEFLNSPISQAPKQTTCFIDDFQ